MMKKSLLYSAMAGMLCLGSCSQDDFAPEINGNGDGNVTFTVTLNDKPATRAFGDGLSAKNLAYAVYDVTDSNDVKLVGEYTKQFDNSLTTTVSLQLANGRDYKVAFFASNATGENDVYTFDAANQNVTVDYDKLNLTAAQTVDNDCFYNAVEIKRTDLNKAQSVILTRPVAQINFGSADLEEDAVKALFGQNVETLYTTVTASGYTTLNLLDGSIDGDKVDFTTNTPASPIASEYGSFPVNGYSYLHCTYVLVPKGETTINDVKLAVYNGATKHIDVEVSNVPIQANYRTNIYGKLLTSQADITVTKDKEWSDEYNISLWDGSIADELPVVTDGVMLVSTPAQLAKVAKEVNDGNNFKDVTIKLTQDIDLNNVNWTPIGKIGAPFTGSFDGQGYMISNLSITQKVASSHVGFFGYVNESKDGLKNVKFNGVKIEVGDVSTRVATGCLVGDAFRTGIYNISVKNVEIISRDFAGGVVGRSYGHLNDCSAEDITLDVALDSNNDNGAKVGAIAGYCAEAGNGYYTANNNSAKNVNISGFRDVGGLFGMMHYTRSMENNTITNVEISVNTDRMDKTTDVPENFGPIVGRWGKTGNTFAKVGEGNTFSNYTLIDENGNETVIESGTVTQADAK